MMVRHRARIATRGVMGTFTGAASHPRPPVCSRRTDAGQPSAPCLARRSHGCGGVVTPLWQGLGPSRAQSPRLNGGYSSRIRET